MNKKLTIDASWASSERASNCRPRASPKLPETAQAFIVQMQTLNASWRMGLAEMQKRDADFACRLARSTTPSDAMEVCTDWMSSRVGSVFEIQTQFFDSWSRYAGGLPSGPVLETNPFEGVGQGTETAPAEGTKGS